jgi:hypothetical protein
MFPKPEPRVGSHCTPSSGKNAGCRSRGASAKCDLLKYNLGNCPVQVAADYERRLRLRANASLPLVYLDVGIKGKYVGR